MGREGFWNDFSHLVFAIRKHTYNEPDHVLVIYHYRVKRIVVKKIIIEVVKMCLRAKQQAKRNQPKSTIMFTL